MFQLFDDFKVYDDNLQPLSLETERHTPIDNMHAEVENGEFCFNSIGNRLIFKTPELSHFRLELKFGFTCLYEFDPNFTVLFQYNKKTRQGKGLTVRYSLEKKLVLSLIALDKMKVRELDTAVLDDMPITEEDRLTLTMELAGGTLSGDIDGKPFRFACGEGKGYVAMERKNYIGQWIIKSFCLTSDEEMEEALVVPETTVDIPLMNGGDIPYKLTWSVKRLGGRLYLDCALSGGTPSREKNREDRPGQYVAETDILRDPYVRLRRGSREEKFYIFRGDINLVDPNIWWDCLKEYWKMPEMPITSRFALPERLMGEDTTISYGYAHFWAEGYTMQEGGSSEFMYDMQGNLLYEGDELAENLYELQSPADKKAVSLVPKDLPNRHEVVAHLEKNHYFAVDEDISLTLVVRTKLDPRGFSATAQFRDIYDSETLAEFTPAAEVAPWKLGYQELRFTVKHPPMEEKLYRVSFTVSYGGAELNIYERVFEVYDSESDVSPAVASGLPYVFSMPNEQKWLSRNTFDLWNPMASCDVEHYISCITDTPHEARAKQVWKAIKPFKREWFVWLGSRTTRDWSVDNNLDIIQNCNYIMFSNGYPGVSMHWFKSYVYSPDRIRMMQDFLDLHPEVAQKLSFQLPDPDKMQMVQMQVDEAGENYADVAFTQENLKEFMDLCYPQWYDYCTKLKAQKHEKATRILRELNPKIKRAGYGPFNQYASATGSYHSATALTRKPDNSMADEQDGFFVYEDYPFACNYQTYRGTFCLATTLLHSPQTVLYPEQYKGGDSKKGLGGCIDGAVKFAHAPMGAYRTLPYQLSTHAFEFVFNTAQRVSGGYRYWNTYGFHRPDYPHAKWDRVVKDWKYVLDYKPMRPFKTHGYLAEYTIQEDIFDTEVESMHAILGIKNRSEDSHGYLHDCSREGGLNAGFAIRFETLKELESTECDMLYIPTLKGVEPEVAAQLRRLYEQGVGLVAVSDVDGLEDIFGVVRRNRKATVDTLEVGEDMEYIYPLETEFYYDSADAQVLATANGEPLVLCKGRAMLINAPLTDIGYECYEGFNGKVKKNVSPLLKESMIRFLRNLVQPCVLGLERLGPTLFETEKGDTVLMAIDYSPMDNIDREARPVTVELNQKGFQNTVSDRNVMILRDENGDICRLRFNILPQETVFIKLL